MIELQRDNKGYQGDLIRCLCLLSLCLHVASMKYVNCMEVVSKSFQVCDFCFFMEL